MAVVKCKECGNEISSKAESCPNCGAVLRKKTSLITWLFLILIIALAISSLAKVDKRTGFQSNSTTKKNSNNGGGSTPDSKPEVIKKSQWATTAYRDEMSGKVSHYAMSKITLPNRIMGFPYSSVTSQLVIGCDKEENWAYIGFNDSPNFANDETNSGYSAIDTRIKFDETLERHVFTQDWGSNFVHFSRDDELIKKIKSSSSLSVEFQWHGEQPVIFIFDLTGSAKAINEIHSECSTLNK
jgi:RNA polymerase subunit RPABC4/transcription elongation factor Spt4